MKVELPIAGYHRVRVHLDDGESYYRRWCYPTADQSMQGHSVIYGPGFADEFAQPPSADLIAICEARAPWYVILDKLTEEYPQWEPYFAAAAEWERGRH